jgi:hypothetical protein
MDEKVVRQEIEADLRAAPSQTVIYLEGKTDVEPFFGLLGVTPLPVLDGGQHQGVNVKGLRKRGSGRTAVADYVSVAGRFNYPGVFGIVDGDGRSLGTLAPLFDAPFSGPLFAWKAYCIENLLAKTGWPSGWGDAPDWHVELAKYGPYVALGRVHRELMDVLETLQVHRFTNPILGEALRTSADVHAALSKDKHLIQVYDVALRFQGELATFEAAVQNSLDEAHALLKGKWLIDHLVPSLKKQLTPEQVRDGWTAHAVSVGGLAEVRDLWTRVTRQAP